MTLLHGDCLELMKTLPDNSVDSIVTDPPYGLSFMGKQWDYDVPSTDIWKECLRVLKPGGHLLAFFGTRTYHRGVVRIEDAGFEIRDQIQWIYGSGFPKSHNIGDGRGTALKPANEPIVVARKPLEKGLNIAENVQKWGTGALNIDGSRIGVSADDPNHRKSTGGYIHTETEATVPNAPFNKTRDATLTQGRWPANVLFDEEAAAVLDEQSGILKSGARKSSIKKESGVTFQTGGVSPCQASEGGASRFFYVAKASKKERNTGLEGMPLVEIKGDVSIRSKGVHGQTGKPNSPTFNQNHHPTVKPIKLMEYLINLVTPPNGSVLDPFMGSGSTGVAARNLNREFIGIELNEEYFKIAASRIEGVG